MHDKLSKLMSKKKVSPMSDLERDAKMSVVDHMRNEASKEMGKRLDGLKKVSVMSDSKEGLKEGLDKAKELMDHIPGHSSEGSPEEETAESAEEESNESPEHEMLESPEQEQAEHKLYDEDMPSDEDDNMGEDEINAKLEKLMALKKKKESKR